MDDGNLVDGELARKRDAICTGFFAPGGTPGVVNIRLCRYMGLHLGHVDGELARKRDAICTGFFAPGGTPGVVNIRLCRYMGLHLGHVAANLKKKAPVLDDEGIGAEPPATVDKRERLGHLLVFDDDIDGHIDTRPSEVRGTAGCLE